MSICWDNLAEIRKSRGISLEEIAASTRISRSYLRAIETGDFSRLPGGIYSTNYIRQYASAISLDGDEVVEAFRQQFETSDKSIEPVRKPQTSKLEMLVGWIFSPTRS